MISIFLIVFALIFSLGSVILTRANSRMFNRCMKEAEKEAQEKAKYAEYDQIVRDIQAESINLEFNKFQTYNVKSTCPDLRNPTSYQEIINYLIKKYDKNPGDAVKTSWFVPMLESLKAQNQGIDFAFQDIKHLIELLEEKGFKDIAIQSKLKIQSVLNTFSKNRDQSVLLITQIHEADDQKLIQKQHKVLHDIIQDDEEIINGLDVLRAGIRRTLSKFCEDESTDHISDLSDLHFLLKIPSALDHAVEEAKKAEVPTIEFPAKRAIDYFPNLGIPSNAKPEETKPQESRWTVADEGFAD